jgi:hypothetical protein
MEEESAARNIAENGAKQLFLEIIRHATMIEQQISSRLEEKIRQN